MLSLILGPCDNTVADYQPPMECMPVQVTNFVPYMLNEAGEPIIENGKLKFYQETNMQCMVPCNKTGSLLSIDMDSIGYFSACILDWHFRKIKVDGQELWCVDNFGDPTYQKPYFDDNWQKWVIPVDILTHEPLIYLTYNYES